MSRLSHVPPQSLGAPAVRGLPQPTVPNQPYNVVYPAPFDSFGTVWTGGSDTLAEVRRDAYSTGHLEGAATDPMGGRYILTPDAASSTELIYLYRIEDDGSRTLLDSFNAATAAETLFGTSTAMQYPHCIALTDTVAVVVLGGGRLDIGATNYNGVVVYFPVSIEGETIAQLSGGGNYSISTGDTAGYDMRSGVHCTLGDGRALFVYQSIRTNTSPDYDYVICLSFEWDGTTFSRNDVVTLLYNTPTTGSITGYGMSLLAVSKNEAIFSQTRYHHNGSTASYPRYYRRIVLAADGTLTVTTPTTPSEMNQTAANYSMVAVPITETRFIVIDNGAFHVASFNGTSFSILSTFTVPVTSPAVNETHAWLPIRVNDTEFFMANCSTDGFSVKRLHLILFKLESDGTATQVSSTDAQYTVTNLPSSTLARFANAYARTPGKLWLHIRNGQQYTYYIEAQRA